MHDLVGGMMILAVDERKKSKEQLRTERALAVNAIFAQHLGAAGTRLQGWQDACLAVHREPANSIKKCKKILQTVHVSLMDFADALENHTVVPKSRIYGNQQKLAAYLKNHRNQIYPKDAAKENIFYKSVSISQNDESSRDEANFSGLQLARLKESLQVGPDSSGPKLPQG
ncbi:MAG: hypothetical protein Q9160_007429 [Pyrenula sp. 1 TL-2023]